MCIFKVNKKLMLADAKKILFLVQERMEFWGHLLHTVSSYKILVSKKKILN